MRQFLLLILMSCYFFAKVTYAKVMINEVSPRTDPEWVELYNQSSEAIDLTLYKLVDKAGNTEFLTNLATVSANTYVVFTRPKGWLNDTTEEYLYLFAPNLPDPLDSLSYTSIQEGKTIARVPDLSVSWLINQLPSMGFANPDPSPSPSPSSIDNATVSPSPSPSASLPPPQAIASTPATPTPTPTQLPTPTPTLKPSLLPSLMPSIEPSHEGTVAGDAIIDLSVFAYSTVSNALREPLDASSTPLQLNPSRVRFALITGTGFLLISLAGYLSYIQYHKSKTELSKL